MSSCASPETSVSLTSEGKGTILMVVSLPQAQPNCYTCEQPCPSASWSSGSGRGSRPGRALLAGGGAHKKWVYMTGMFVYWLRLVATRWGALKLGVSARL
jgi:hypothetical protein